MAAPDLTQRECVYVQKEGTDDPGANLVGKPYSRLTIGRALLDLADTTRYPPASSTFFHIVSVGPGTFVESGIVLPPWTFISGECDGEGQPNTIIQLQNSGLSIATAWNAGATRGGFMNLTLNPSGGTPIIDNTMPTPLSGNPARSVEWFNVHHNLTEEVFEATSTADVWVRELCRQFGTNTDTLKQTGGTSRFNQNWSAASATIVDKTGFAAAGNWNGFIVTNALASLTANSIAAAGCTLRLSSSSVIALVLAQTAPGVLAVSADTSSVPVRSAVSVTGTATIAANFTYLSDAAGEGYSPTVPGNWPAGIANVQQALDAIAAGSVIPFIPIPVPIVDGGTGQSTPAAAFDALRPALKITYTGTPQTALILPLVPGIAVVPSAAVSGQATYAAAAGPTISLFTYVESTTPIAGKQITALSFDDLAGVAGNFTPNTMAALTTLQANALVSVGTAFGPNIMAALTTLQVNALTNVGGAFNPNTMPALTTLQVNALTNVGGNFNPTIMAALTTLQANALVNVGGNFTPATMAALTTLQANALVNVGGNFNPNTMAALTTLNFNAIQNIVGNVNPNTMASLTTVSLSGMVAYGAAITIPSATTPNVSSVTLGTVGTLKSIGGATITLSGLKLPSANVNAILALLVSLDGTNGTTLWGAGKTLLINGGTNGAPTGQGIVDKATLITRGATVTTN